MGAENAPKKEGREAGEMYRKAAAEEERHTEKAKGGDLARGKDRFEERAESARGDRGVKPSD